MSASAQAQESFIDKVSNVFEGDALLVRAGIMPALEQGRLDTIRFEDADGLRNFYTVRDFTPIWIAPRSRDKGERVRALLDVLEESWLHGFNPYDYHYGELVALLSQKDEQSFYALELLASDAVIRYTRDLSSMRVGKHLVSSTIRKLQKRPITEEVLAYMAEESNVERALRHFEPAGNLYALLQAELYELVKGQPPAYEAVLPLRMQGLLRPGEGHRIVPAIRMRLGISDIPSEGASYYDDDLAQAVMAFQQENGLKADGVVGPNTLEVMNISRADKIERVIANLERLRWIARDTPERYVLVNIPSAMLWAIEGGDVVLDMPVILGRKERATNSFVTTITGIRFNPNWTLPPTIKREDFLPNLVEDPYYATNRGIEIVQGYGNNAQTIDPATIDWASVTEQDLKNIRMVQDPGTSNPLGQMRVIMDNPYNIYLHDTNKRHYFQKDDRFLSSGCVRVSKPEELAHFIMEGRSDWGEQKLQDVLRSGKLTEISTAAPVPVFILYQTVWLGEDGHVVYGQDVYGEDKRLIAYMKQNQLYKLPAAFE